MLACMRTAAVYGIEAFAIQVEVDVSFGLPSFTMVGLPDAGIRESRDRIRSAIRNSGFEFPPHRITVNLSPADVRKEGASFDLPIALGVLAASGLLVRRDVDDLLLVGALSLDGAIQPTRGVLPVASAARRNGYRGLLLPEDNQREAAAVQGLDLYGVRHLPEAVRALNDPRSFDRPLRVAMAGGPPAAAVPDFADVHGQLLARRALEIAAAGGHNALLVGPPGAGKTMMARRLAGILPPLTQDEAVEVTTVHSVAGLIPAGAGLLDDPAVQGAASYRQRCRAGRWRDDPAAWRDQPGASRRAVPRRDAGVQPPRPGSVAAATRRRGGADCARRPHRDLPRRLHAGGRDESVPVRVCRQRAAPVPLHAAAGRALRIAAVGAVARSHRSGGVGRGSSAARPARRCGRRGIVGDPRRAWSRRGAVSSHGMGRSTRGWKDAGCARGCGSMRPSRTLLEKAVSRLTLSARAFDRVLRVGRTIADLAQSEAVTVEHLAEALQFRGSR